MGRRETLRRVQDVHERRGAYHVCAQGGDSSARSGVQKTSRREPPQARTQAKSKTEGQAFRFFGPRCLVRRRRHLLADSNQFGVGKPFADDLRDGHREPIRVVHILPIVEAKRLLIQIPKQVVRFDRNIGPVDSALEQRPKIFARVCVNLPVHVSYGVIYDLVCEFFIKPIVGLQRIAIERGTAFYVVAYQRLQLMLAALVYDLEREPCRRAPEPPQRWPCLRCRQSCPAVSAPSRSCACSALCRR